MRGSCRDSKGKSSKPEIIKLYRLASSSWRDRYVNAVVVMMKRTIMYACMSAAFSGRDNNRPPPLLCVIVQVKTLQLERDQGQMLLENVQHRHKQDMELMDNTHK